MATHGPEHGDCPVTPIQTISIDNIPTEYIYFPRDNTDTPSERPAIVVVTGNPGLIAYYTPFMRALHRDTEGQVDIYGVGFAGHLCTRELMDASALYSLEDQIRHKRDFLAYLQEEKGQNSGFVVLAHSIGSYIMMQVMHRWAETDIRHLLCLFPCYKDFPSNAPRSVKVMMQPATREVVAATSGLIGIMPKFIKRPFFRHVMKLSPHATTVTTHGLSRATSRNVLFLARAEHDTLHEMPHDVISNQLDRLTFYFGTEDKWGPLYQAEELKREYPSANVHIDEQGIPHAFCVHHSHETADIALPLIRPHLDLE